YDALFLQKNIPARPELKSSNVPGSGTDTTLPGPDTTLPVVVSMTTWPMVSKLRPRPLQPLLPSSPVPVQPVEIVSLINVTAPVCAKARPQSMVTPLFMEMLASARRFPAKSVVVSRVAELPIFQKTPAPVPVLITLTTEAGEVMSVSIWKSQNALALP